MTHDDDDVLAAIDLHAWRVPPPLADRATILAGALTPATSRKRPRTGWLIAAFAVANVVLAAILVIVVSRRPEPSTVVVRAGGGPAFDPQTQDVLRRLEAEQRDLERKLADVQQLRTVVEQLSERVRQCEQGDKHDRPAPPAPVPGPTPAPQPSPAPAPACDEVSCVLTNYQGTCCDRFRLPAPRFGATSNPNALPDALDRAMISSAMAVVRDQIQLCDVRGTATGKVKVNVRVAPDGTVVNVNIESAPDAALGRCVADVLEQAKFARTHHGGSFSYPFVFGASP